jgi:glycine cleavage system aminomethyltransferase T
MPSEGAHTRCGDRRQPLHANVRRSPYFPRTEALGAAEYMVYNHMYMPVHYGRDPREEYEAMTRRVTLWDVGAQRQTQLRGPDALGFAEYLCTRELSTLDVGQCRYTMICDDRGQIMTEPIVLRPFPDTLWISHGDVDLGPWARALSLCGDYDVTVDEPDVAPVQIHGPAAEALVRSVADGASELAYYRCCVADVCGVRTVVSRTGWSRDPAYEVYPLDGARSLAIWDGLVEAGADHGLLVAGPNLSRAVEHGITDTHYFVNSEMNPFEAGAGHLVDLDRGAFVGRDALAEIKRTGPRRETVGLLGPPEARSPVLRDFWPLLTGQQTVGAVRWCAYSYALERPAAIALVQRDRPRPGQLVIDTPTGPMPVALAKLPFVR